MVNARKERLGRVTYIRDVHRLHINIQTRNEADRAKASEVEQLSQ